MCEKVCKIKMEENENCYKADKSEPRREKEGEREIVCEFFIQAYDSLPFLRLAPLSV